MTINWKHVLAGAAVLLLFALCLSAYVSEREDRIRAEVTVSATQKAIGERDKATADLIQQLKDAAAKVTRPEQVPQALPQVIQLPAPVVQVQDVQHSAHSAANNVQDTAHPLPDAASSPTVAKAGDLIIPKIDVVPLYQQLNTCKQNESLLSTCQADLKDTKTERDAAMTAVKGGSFFTRLKRNAKWFAIGAGVGAGGILATRH